MQPLISARHLRSCLTAMIYSSRNGSLKIRPPEITLEGMGGGLAHYPMQA
jgi:hypothetical protein